MADPEIRQIRDTISRIASEVTTIYEGWPTLLRTLGEISRRLEEHERRIIKLESHAFLPIPPMRAQFKSSEWDNIGEESPSGMHRALTISEFEKLKLKDKAIIFDRLKHHLGKILTHVITIIITGTLALVWHYLKDGK